MENKIRLIYLDEDTAWQSMAYHRLKDDFTLDIPETLPKKIEDIWSKIEEFAPQVIMIDYRLNESGTVSYTGDDVIKELHKHNKHLPMFIITSYEDYALITCEEAQIIRSKDILEKTELLDKLKNIITGSVNNYNRRKVQAESIIRNIQEKITNGEVVSEVESGSRFDAELYLSELDLDNGVRADLLTSRSNNTLDELLNIAQKIIALRKK